MADLITYANKQTAVNPANPAANEVFTADDANQIKAVVNRIKTPLVFDETNLVLDADNGGYYLPVTGLLGRWPQSIKNKIDTKTITAYTLEDDDAWTEPRYYGFTSNTDFQTISIQAI